MKQTVFVTHDESGTNNLVGCVTLIGGNVLLENREELLFHGVVSLWGTVDSVRVTGGRDI